MDFPAPEGPTTATDSPAATSSDTASTMVSSPSGLLTCLVRSLDLRTLAKFIFGAWALGMAFLSAAATEAAGTVLVLGDSLSAGYGLEPGQGWVTLLEKRLGKLGYEYRVVNASISGETTAGGLERAPRALQLHKPEIVVVELGANDGLRGLPIRHGSRQSGEDRDAHAARQARRHCSSECSCHPTTGRDTPRSFAGCTRTSRKSASWRSCPSCSNP